MLLNWGIRKEIWAENTTTASSIHHWLKPSICPFPCGSFSAETKAQLCRKHLSGLLRWQNTTKRENCIRSNISRKSNVNNLLTRLMSMLLLSVSEIASLKKYDRQTFWFCCGYIYQLASFYPAAVFYFRFMIWIKIWSDNEFIVLVKLLENINQRCYRKIHNLPNMSVVRIIVKQSAGECWLSRTSNEVKIKPRWQVTSLRRPSNATLSHFCSACCSNISKSLWQPPKNIPLLPSSRVLHLISPLAIINCPWSPPPTLPAEDAHIQMLLLPYKAATGFTHSYRTVLPSEAT